MFFIFVIVIEDFTNFLTLKNPIQRFTKSSDFFCFDYGAQSPVTGVLVVVAIKIFEFLKIPVQR